MIFLLLDLQKHDKLAEELKIFLMLHLCFFLSPRILLNCKDDSLNVAVPMRMLEIFSSERTYLLVIPDANYVASLLEQILHYMVQKGKFTVTEVLFTLWIKKMHVFVLDMSKYICVLLLLSVLSFLWKMQFLIHFYKRFDNVII